MLAQNDTNSSAYSSVMADGGKVTLESVQDDSHKAYMELKHDGQIGFAFSSGETVHMLTVDASGVNVFDPPTEGTNVVNKDYLEQAISDAGGTEVETTLTVLTASGWDSNSKTQRAEVTGILADETKQLIQPVPAISSQQGIHGSRNYGNRAKRWGVDFYCKDCSEYRPTSIYKHTIRKVFRKPDFIFHR